MSATRLAYNADEAAALVGLKPDTIRAAIRSGQLKAVKSARTNKDTNPTGKPGRYLIRRADLEAWLDSMETA